MSGVGYNPHGQFSLEGQEFGVEDRPDLVELGRAGLLCNDAELTAAESEWVLHGDPTEGALIALGVKAGLDPRLERERLPRTDVIPFESEYRFMATLHRDPRGHTPLFI